MRIEDLLLLTLLQSKRKLGRRLPEKLLTKINVEKKILDVSESRQKELLSTK